ncbi:MAG: peptide chain release factor-like protein [Planctomycetes bacterium]|nr:peptide chain release factor-like protein [Planctomycetota bacterium]
MAAHPAQLDVDDLLAECEIGRQRRSGPGGQHRNKVETAVRIRHCPTGIEAMATESRRQEVNRKKAIQRLRLLLALRHRRTAEFTNLDTATYRVPEEIATRIRKGRLAVNTEHTDYPSVIAELMDLIIVWAQGNVPDVAGLIGTSASQIIKLMRGVPEGLKAINDLRRERGEHALR